MRLISVYRPPGGCNGDDARWLTDSMRSLCRNTGLQGKSGQKAIFSAVMNLGSLGPLVMILTWPYPWTRISCSPAIRAPSALAGRYPRNRPILLKIWIVVPESKIVDFRRGYPVAGKAALIAFIKSSQRPTSRLRQSDLADPALRFLSRSFHS